MNSNPTIPIVSDAQQVLASAVARQIERLSKEEVQALVATADLALQKENAALRQRILELEADLARLQHMQAEYQRTVYKLTRDFVTEKDWENFDPGEYTISAEELLANGRKHLQ